MDIVHPDLSRISPNVDLTGSKRTWFALQFTSNYRNPYHGVFVDNIQLAKTSRGLVYKPNPLMTTGDMSLQDNADADSQGLREALEMGGLGGLIGSPYLQGEFVDLANGHPDFLACDTLKPTGIAESETHVFSYTRSHDGFEEVNVYHHISQYHRYLHRIGITTTLNRAVYVHAHCSQNDQSGASPDFSLAFGEGGVDDAEDGEVVIHEYAHLILYEVLGDTGQSWPEFDAIHEGFGDYLASSYFASQAISPTFAACFGEWDAQGVIGTLPYTNPRCYRRLDNPKVYPHDMVGERHTDGEIYAGALWDIRAQLGQTTTDYLVVRSIKYLTNTDRFAEAGYGIIMADQYWFQGQNVVTIATAFKGRGIFDTYEWNDSADYATLLTPDTPAQTHRFDACRDEDWFALDIPAGLGEYEITVTSAQTQTDTFIALYAPDQQTWLAENNDCPYLAHASCITWTAFGQGPYYLQVKPVEASKAMTGITHTYIIALVTSFEPLFLYLPIIQRR